MRPLAVVGVCVLSCCVGLRSAGSPPLQRFEFRAARMGTQFRIVLYTSDEPSAIAASQAAFERVDQLDRMLSDYQADSELMQLCAKSGGPPVHVSNELFFVLSRSQELAARSDGAFDVTVGPAVRLWRRARRQHKLPDADRIAQARELVGFEKLRLDTTAQTVQLLKPNMQLDLGGIAKGYAADEAIATLKKLGINQALVAAGGDIVCSQPPPGESGWTIAIASPDGPDHPPVDFLSLHDAGVSTSGDAEQFVEIDGTRYSHIIHPKTAQAMTDRLQVTVVAPNGITSDSLDTAVSVLGIERGMKLIESTPGVAAMIVRITDAGFIAEPSSRYQQLPKGRPKHPTDSPE